MSIFNALCLRQPGHRDINIWRERAFGLAFTGNGLDLDLRLQTGVYLVVHLLWLGDFAKSTVAINTLQAMVGAPKVSDLTRLFVNTAEALHYFHMGMDARNRQTVFEALEYSAESGVHVWDDHLVGHGLASALSEADMTTVDILLPRLKANLNETRRFDFAYYHVVMGWKDMLEQKFDSAYEHLKIMLQLMNGVGFLAATAAATIGLIPEIDVYEEKGELIVKADLPGMKKEDVEVTLRDNVLTISGERKSEEKTETGDYKMYERSHGSFSRSIRLPYEVVPEKTNAHFENGVLEIRLTETVEAESKVKKIPVTS